MTQNAKPTLSKIGSLRFRFFCVLCDLSKPQVPPDMVIGGGLKQEGSPPLF